MRPVLRCSIPIVMAALAMANTGCGSKSSERSPTSPAGPQTPVAGKTGQTGVSALGLRPMAVAPSLGAADSFAVLGSSTVTNTGPTTVNGDLGVSPGSTLVGFPPGIINGTTHLADAASLAAQNSIVTAYNALAGQACDLNLSGTDLGGLTLTPGTYCFSTSAQLTGTLTLNGQGNAGAVWVFQIGSTLTTASGSRVVFSNSGQACGAFWQVGSSATLGTTTAFSGNILALASVTLNTGATSSGALFARTGAVTLDSNTVSRVGSCGSAAPVPTLPEAATWGLLAILLATGVFVLSRR
jgi:hypothetical protein